MGDAMNVGLKGGGAARDNEGLSDLQLLDDVVAYGEYARDREHHLQRDRRVLPTQTSATVSRTRRTHTTIGCDSTVFYRTWCTRTSTYT